MTTSSLVTLATTTVGAIGTYIFAVLPTVWLAVIGFLVFFAILGWILYKRR